MELIPGDMPPSLLAMVIGLEGNKLHSKEDKVDIIVGESYKSTLMEIITGRMIGQELFYNLGKARIYALAISDLKIEIYYLLIPDRNVTY